MKSACVGVLSIIELKNAWWSIEICIYVLVSVWFSKYAVDRRGSFMPFS